MLKTSFIGLSFLLSSLNVYADTNNQQSHQFMIQTSFWTHHYQHDPDHNNQQELINAIWYPSAQYQLKTLKDSNHDWGNHTQWFVGGATFKNSFSQRTYYGYIGGRYRFNKTQSLEPYLRLTGGLLHGYRGKYQDKVPFNKYKTAPVLVPSVGVDIQQISLELVAFAASGVMLNIGYYFR